MNSTHSITKASVNNLSIILLTNFLFDNKNNIIYKNKINVIKGPITYWYLVPDKNNLLFRN